MKTTAVATDVMNTPLHNTLYIDVIYYCCDSLCVLR